MKKLFYFTIAFLMFAGCNKDTDLESATMIELTPEQELSNLINLTTYNVEDFEELFCDKWWQGEKYYQYTDETFTEAEEIETSYGTICHYRDGIFYNLGMPEIVWQEEINHWSFDPETRTLSFKGYPIPVSGRVTVLGISENKMVWEVSNVREGKVPQYTRAILKVVEPEEPYIRENYPAK